MKDTFDLRKSWEPYVSLLPLATVASVLERAVRMAGEPLVELVPSIILASDGPKISTFFGFTDSLLAEISADGNTFDYVDRRRMIIVRWTFGKAEAPGPEGTSSAKYQTVSVLLYHGVSQSLIQYVGADAEEWVARLSRAIPATSVLGNWSGNPQPLNDES